MTLHAASPALKFPLGRCVVTRAALAALSSLHLSGFSLLRRHVCGDWSELTPDNQAENAYAVEHGERVFSAYTVDGTKFYVITEADRSATTIMLPDEY